MRVLIVDDSRAMRMMVRRTLRQAGLKNIEVQEASNGKEGLARVREWNPDLVLTDWNMPEMDGISFLSQARQEGYDGPIGVVTSEGSPSMRATAAQAGANFLIQKPFDASDFSTILSAIL